MSEDFKRVMPYEIEPGTEIVFNIFNGDVLEVEEVKHFKSQGVVEFKGIRKSDGKTVWWQVFDQVEFVF